MSESWKNDPRIQKMNPEKINFLSAMIAKIQQSSPNQLLGQFMMLNTEASRQGLSFSDEETALLTEVLIGYMNPAYRGRLDLLRMLSKKIASGHLQK